MKKLTYLVAGLVLGCTAINAQAVRDRNVIPVAVNLNQVLRMTITNGGNIEFTFNSIDDYRDGLSGDAATSGSANNTAVNSNPMYISDFTIASSTRWELSYGSEQPTFIGTDNPANNLNLDNVGYGLTSNGTHAFGTELTSLPTTDGADIAALQIFPTVLITDNGNVLSSAGDVLDNSFTMTWRAGTTETAGAFPMNATSILEQNPSPAPDRYITNVLFELAAI